MDNYFEEDKVNSIEESVDNIVEEKDTFKEIKELTVEVNIPESFIRNIKCKSALSEYNDWAEYLKKELEDMYIDVLRDGIRKLGGKDNL